MTFDHPITVAELHDLIGDLGRSQAEKRRGESATQALTRRNNEMLAAGIHPATRKPLLIGCGEQCATCTHLRVGYHSKRYYKCEKHRLGTSHSASSDVRISWPACALYEPAPASVDAFNAGRQLSRDRLAVKLETRGKEDAS